MGIYIAAVIASLVAAGLCGWIGLRITDPACRRVLLVIFLLTLPLQPIVFYVIRLPALSHLQSALGNSIAMLIVGLLAAPLTEEPAKWLVLSSADVRRAIASGSAMGVAIATGLGFGIGEIWFLAEQFSRLPAVQAAPFTHFSGFMVERVAVCLLHGLFLVPLFHAIAVGRHIMLGAAVGMLGHLLANLPILALQADLFALGREFWGGAIMVWLIVLLAMGLYVVNLFSKRRLVCGALPAAPRRGG